MSSTKLPKPTEPDGPDGTDFLLDAVSAVAERSFFAVTEPCDEGRFKELAETLSGWLVASVRFEEGPLTGSVSCTLPDELGRALCNALTGRGPADPPPTPDEIHDVIGEFSNMVCGAWLSRMARQTFSLSPPVVEPAVPPVNGGDGSLLVTLHDLPLAVDVTFTMRTLSTMRA